MWYYLTHSWRRIRTFSHGIRVKVDVIVWPELELSYYTVAAQHVSHNTTDTPCPFSWKLYSLNSLFKIIKILFEQIIYPWLWLKLTSWLELLPSSPFFCFIMFNWSPYTHKDTSCPDPQGLFIMYDRLKKCIIFPLCFFTNWNKDLNSLYSKPWTNLLWFLGLALSVFIYKYLSGSRQEQCNPDIRELSGPEKRSQISEFSYIRFWSILLTLTQALIWDQRKSLLYQGLLYRGLLYQGLLYPVYSHCVIPACDRFVSGNGEG